MDNLIIPKQILINILDGMFPYVREKQYFYMIFEESEKIV